MIYLDNAATTWPKPKEVAEAVAACIEAVPGTPGRGSHQGARQAARIAFEAREEQGVVLTLMMRRGLLLRAMPRRR